MRKNCIFPSAQQQHLTRLFLCSFCVSSIESRARGRHDTLHVNVFIEGINGEANAAKMHSGLIKTEMMLFNSIPFVNVVINLVHLLDLFTYNYLGVPNFTL